MELDASVDRDDAPWVTDRARRPGRPAAWAPSLTSRTAVQGPAGLWYADVPDRVLAFLLDVIALAVVGLFLAIIVGGAFGGLSSGTAAGGSIDAPPGALNVGAFVVVGILAMVVSFVYFAYSWVVLRSTPGMRMLGLRIGHQRDGRPISWDQALVRWIVLGIAATSLTFAVYVPSLVGLALAVLGLLWLVLMLVTLGRSPTKQGLHDRYARTILVRAPRRAV
jgi:uncharacterized RDD family membrane protein YckC